MGAGKECLFSIPVNEILRGRWVDFEYLQEKINALDSRGKTG